MQLLLDGHKNSTINSDSMGYSKAKQKLLFCFCFHPSAPFQANLASSNSIAPGRSNWQPFLFLTLTESPAARNPACRAAGGLPTLCSAGAIRLGPRTALLHLLHLHQLQLHCPENAIKELQRGKSAYCTFVRQI